MIESDSYALAAQNIYYPVKFRLQYSARFKLADLDFDNAIKFIRKHGCTNKITKQCPFEFILSPKHNHNVRAPIVYEKRVLRKLIEKIEENDLSACDWLIEYHVANYTLPEISEIKRVLVLRLNENGTIYDRRNEKDIIIEENITTLQSGTTGLALWQAAYVLAESLVHYLSTTKRKEVNIIELGSGCASTAIIVSSFNLHTKLNYYCTDKNNAVVQQGLVNIGKNRELNNLIACTVQYHILDWFDDSLPALPTNDRLIVAADVLFDPCLLEPLLKTIERLRCEDDTATALIVYAQRQLTTIEQFESMLIAKQLPYKHERNIERFFNDFSRRLVPYHIDGHFAAIEILPIRSSEHILNYGE